MSVITASARLASLGVNGAGLAVMLAVFLQTGGLTGAEVGIAAATAFLNQKLMNAIFGEASVQEMIERATNGLRATLAIVLEEDARRFRVLLPAPHGLRGLADELRATARRADRLDPLDEAAPAPDQATRAPDSIDPA
jgi:hypothetical protein